MIAKSRKFAAQIGCLATALSFLLGGCESPTRTIWSAQSKSPDGKWLALAHTENTAGPGINAQYTIVELKQNFAKAKPIQILTFDEDQNGVKIVSMSWENPSHLRITYQGDATLLFEAVKAFGEDITIEHVPK